MDADGAFTLMDPIIYEGAEGRRRKKTKDPLYTGPIHYIDRGRGDRPTPGGSGGDGSNTETSNSLGFSVGSRVRITHEQQGEVRWEDGRRWYHCLHLTDLRAVL